MKLLHVCYCKSKRLTGLADDCFELIDFKSPVCTWPYSNKQTLLTEEVQSSKKNKW
jgi:hypothetical protein